MSVLSGLQKFFTKDRVTIFVIFGVLIFFLAWYSGLKYDLGDSMDSISANAPSVDQAPSVVPPSVTADVPAVAPGSAPVQPVAQGGYAQKKVANPSDLLPTDQNSQWASLNPVAQSQGSADLLQAGYHIGIDTIGQTLKNANLQLRSDPIIPKQNVGPWNQSTYEPDLMRVPLEVGVVG